MVGKISLLSLAAVAGVTMAQSRDYPGVVSSNANGPTNPDDPELGTDTPDDSEARLLTVNNIDVRIVFETYSHLIRYRTSAYSVPRMPTRRLARLKPSR